MVIAHVASLRSTCRVKHGAVATLDDHIVSTGYNGSRPGEAHCCDVGCHMRWVRERERCVRTLHAEHNALAHATVPPDTLYCTGQPCLDCWHEIVHRGESGTLRRLVYSGHYSDIERDHEWHHYKGPVKIQRLTINHLSEIIHHELLRSV